RLDLNTAEGLFRFFALPNPKYGQRPPLQSELLGAFHCLTLGHRIRGIEDEQPAMLVLGDRERERNRIVMGVEQDEQSFADDRLPAIIGVADQIAGESHPEAANKARVPSLVGHLLSG